MAKLMIALTIEYESIIVSNPTIDQVRALFASPTLSDSALLITIWKAAITIIMTAIGAAKYNNPPATI